MSVVAIHGGTDDPFWPIRVEVSTPGEQLPPHFWMLYHWQFLIPAAKADRTAIAQADGEP